MNKFKETSPSIYCISQCPQHQTRGMRRVSQHSLVLTCLIFICVAQKLLTLNPTELSPCRWLSLFPHGVPIESFQASLRVGLACAPDICILQIYFLVFSEAACASNDVAVDSDCGFSGTGASCSSCDSSDLAVCCVYVLGVYGQVLGIFCYASTFLL